MRASFLILFAFSFGCGREIGDDCKRNSDCGSGAGVICDLSKPGGYCTISSCIEDTCPSEAVCIRFSADDSYCMRRCNDDFDCRKGYVCVKDFCGNPPFCNSDTPRGSTVSCP